MSTMNIPIDSEWLREYGKKGNIPDTIEIETLFSEELTDKILEKFGDVMSCDLTNQLRVSYNEYPMEDCGVEIYVDWDVDCSDGKYIETLRELELPYDAGFDAPLTEDILRYILDEFADDIVNDLSDQYGFCINAVDIKVTDHAYIEEAEKEL